MNHKKSRLTDLFRKMDKNNDGLIPRDDFIDGIMKTSELKINNVHTLCILDNVWGQKLKLRFDFSISFWIMGGAHESAILSYTYGFFFF